MKPIEKIKQEQKGIFQIGIDKEIYIADEYYYQRVKRLRTSITNMKATIKEYNIRIKNKNKYLNDIYNDIKTKFQKIIRS